MDLLHENCVLKTILVLLVVRPAVLHDSLELSYQTLKRLHQLQKVKDRILDGLHLDDVPKLPRGLTHPNVQKALSQLHSAAMAGYNPNLKYPDNMALILFSEPPKTDQDKSTLQFQLTGNGNSFPIEVKSATLFIRMKLRKHRSKSSRPKTNKSRKKKNRPKKIKLLIHHYNRKRKRFRRVSLLKASIKKTKWLKLHLPPSSIEKDINFGNKTILLRITCKRCKQSLSLDMLYKKNAKKNKIGKRKKSKKRRLSHTRPFLVVHSKHPNPTARLRRDLEDCSGSNSSVCCPRQMYVDFREINWDNWILFPPGFTTSTCDGSCAGNQTPQVTSNQASRDRNATNDYTCHPVQTEPLTVVYYKRVNQIERRTIPDLVVRNCGCI